MNLKETRWMLKARSHFVSFRVTDDEFEHLKLSCDLQGARSLSAFARKIILSTPDACKEKFPDRMAVLNQCISVLEVTLARLINALESCGASAVEKQE